MSETEQISDNSIQFSPGSLLKQARERADISIEEVMQQLKLTRQTIVAIENDDYTSDLPATFFRGYLRNYAELLRVDDNDIVENFDNFCKRNDLFAKDEQSLATIELEKPITSSNWMMKIFTTVIVLVILLGIYYVLVEQKVWQKFTSSMSETGVEVETLSVGQDGGALLPISNEDSDLVNEQPIEQSVTQQETTMVTEDELSSEVLSIQPSGAAADSDKSADLNVGDISGELVLVFSDDCWVRITDADGNVLALGIKKGGSSMSLSGPTPIELTLGKPSAVQLSYQNEPIDLSSYPDTRAARLTLGN